MKRHFRLLLSVLLLTAAVVITVSAALQVQKRQGQPSPAHQKAEEDFYTIADYSSPEPADPQKKASRRLRAKRYNLPGDKGVDPRRFAITEQRESTFGSPAFDSGPSEPGLPAAQSDAVVIANVVSAQAFLTEDRTEVISEFKIEVKEILKENVAPFSAGDSLDALRLGGGVRFASGKVIRYGSEGRPLPQTGHRYLFFLKYSQDGGNDYLILTAYDLRAGHVMPLDGINLSSNVEPAYGEYQHYKNVDESSFLTTVMDAISRNLGTKRQVRRP
jgi:hypothetical protein